MALLPILCFPDPRLYTVAQSVARFDTKLKKLVDDMAETMYQANGVGLAATQVNVHQRLIVMDISEDRSELMVLVNPEIIEQDGLQAREEGCLSVPGIYEKVTRSERIKVNFQSFDGISQSLEIDGLGSVCIQHEIDHLNGKVFVQYLSRLKQSRIRTKLSRSVKEKSL